MRATPTADPPTATPHGTTDDAAATSAAGSRAARPETVMVCELIGGAMLIHGVPDEPLALLTGDAATALRTALDTALGIDTAQAGVRGAS